MKSVLLSAAAAMLLAGCQQGADTVANGNAAETTATVPINMTMMADRGAMMRQMQGKPMARDAAMKRMHERHEGMEQIGKSFKTAGKTLKSGSPDLAAVRTSAATIAKLAPKTVAWFPAGTGPDVGKTRAKPEIWQKPADFIARDKAFQQAAAAFDTAARSGDMAAIQARFGNLGKTCKGCHDSYRNEMKH